MSFSLKNHVALVTGSTTGLGKATAYALARAGAAVGITYQRNQERAERMFAEFESQGLAGVLVRGDASTAEGVAEVCNGVKKKFGDIDILVVNATPDQPQLPIEEYTWQHYQTMIDFFIKSPYLFTRRVLPAMKAKKWGRIVNISSEVFQRAVGNFSAYVSAKGGQNGFTRSMATELAPFGITVNSVAPGWIPVERHESDPAEMKEGYRKLIPMGRWGTPDDVAYAVQYFASEEAAFITGQTICVNGGMTPW
ncbi:MAG: 3-oxoacyl-ACP reductase [Planctomycetota bacterium]|nr:MAG: 3-oxoacyl-ACP reductase [Planctomycetota bacterium]